MISIISFSFLKCFTYFPLRGLFKINFKLLCISAYANLKFPLSSMASFAFLAAHFRIWIGMVGHSAEFCFSVSGFVSFSQCHFSYFVYALKKPFLKTMGGEFDHSWLLAIFRAIYRMDLAQVLREFLRFLRSFTCVSAGISPTQILLIV